jgi:transposase
MKRAKTGCAISASGRSRAARRRLERFIKERLKVGDLDGWRRGRAVQGYIKGGRVVDLAKEADVTGGSVNRWLQSYESDGPDGLLTSIPPGAARKLTEEQCSELAKLIEAGPQEAGYTSGVWTGPMIGDLIEERFGIRYHNHHVPRLLHALGFSVQRPRKRLAKADVEAQAHWLRKKLPSIKKSP